MAPNKISLAMLILFSRPHRLISAVSRLHTKYLSWQSWKSRLGLCGVSQPAVYGDDLECPAFEVLKYRHPHGAYGSEYHNKRFYSFFYVALGNDLVLKINIVEQKRYG